MARPKRQRQTMALLLTVMMGLAGVVWLGRWMDAHRPTVDARLEEEQLYVTGGAAKRLSLNFNGLVADWYWMRSLQYVGRRMLSYQGNINIDDLSPLNLKLLSPLLETTTTLDPQFMPAYEYGAFVLSAVNADDAIKLLKKGIEANPQAWRLYYNLGYIYWQHGDYKASSETYAAGANVPDAPSWMKMMSARMAAEGGSHAMAREIYMRMYEESNDPQIKEMVARRLLQVISFEERDVIRRVLSDYTRRTGHCASSWNDVAAALRAARLRIDASGTPLDPADTPYRLVNNGCDVDLDWHSKVPYK